MHDDESVLYASEQLEAFSTSVFQHCGVPPNDARLAASVLATSDLRGIDSHGISRLPMYAGYLSSGQTNPRPRMAILRESPSTASVDGDNGLGLVVGPKANQIAMDKADAVGSGWVSVCHSNHFGIAGYYPLEALRRDMIGWAMTNASSWVAPIWGAERRLGTNPLAIAFPGHEEPPIVIDMATSAVAYGKIQIARRQGQSIPEGWALDEKGSPTTDPDDVPNNGSLLPLGSNRELGGHKGYCLASMVDILSSVLSGANWGPFVPPFVRTDYNTPSKSVGKGIGHFFGAMRIDGFIEPDEFKRQIDDWIRTFRGTKPTPGTNGPLVPGDPEREAQRVRSHQGVPLARSVVDSLRRLAKDMGVPFD
jgi:LDH2 family malate/lactate/ureidoglycolate dehydrogenase